MRNWNELKHGDKVRCKFDDSILEVIVWRDEKYLAGKRNMWLVNQFDPKEWELMTE